MYTQSDVLPPPTPPTTINQTAMTLLPPPEGLSDVTRESLIRKVQEHAGPEGYAVVTYRSKQNKKGVVSKVWLRCTRGGKIRATAGQKRIHRSSRLNECPFKAVAKRHSDGDWYLEVHDASHNHSATLQVAHTARREIALTKEVEEVNVERTKSHATPGAIISGLHHKDDQENPTFRAD